MAVLSLFIDDVALREAVVEQIAAARVGECRVVEGVEALGREAPALLIIDEGVCDAGCLAALRGLADKAVVLLLGVGEDSELFSESFAKPFRLGHLIARVRYYLETAPLLRDRVVVFGPYRLEPQNRRILCDSVVEPIRLTEKETGLLVFLAQRQEAATRQDILAAVWGYDERIDTHTLETHIYQLRRKLDFGGENWLVNEGGAYRLARGAA